MYIASTCIHVTMYTVHSCTVKYMYMYLSIHVYHSQFGYGIHVAEPGHQKWNNS